MPSIAKKDLEELLAEREGPCVTLTLPVQRSAAGIEENRARLRAMLGQAEREVEDRYGARRSAAVLAADGARLNDDAFWQVRQDGVAVFLAPEFSRVFHLSHTVEERIAVGPFFHLRPLLRSAEEEARFLVLALSQGGVRLLRCTRDTVERVPTPEVPQDIEAAMVFEDAQRLVQYHATASPGARQAPGYHGKGGAKEVEKDKILRYFQQVDRGLAAVLAGESAPMVLAAVEHYLPLWRSVSSHVNLADRVVAGSPDRTSDEELRRRAWEIVAPAFDRVREEAVATFRQEAGKGRTAGSVEECVSAALDGRVATLMVANRGSYWGTVDPENSAKVVSRAQRDPGDVDLLELAVRATLTTGGRVIGLAPKALPSHTLAAALLRY